MNRYLVLLLGVITTVNLVAGEREGGGGIVISAEFARTGRRAIEILGFGDSSMNVPSIMTSIAQTKVIPVEELCFNEPTFGKKFCEDAHYDAQNNRVLFAYKNWDTMACQEKLLLSSHEFLRASGLEAEDYNYSGRFIDNSIVQCVGTSSQEQAECADRSVRIDRMMDVFCEELQALASKRK